MVNNSFKLDDIKAYVIASELSDYVWDIASEWSILAQKTIGSQWIDSTDSISGNIAEGFGRYHKRDKVKFYYNSRASVFELAHWTKRAYARGLINREQRDHALNELRKLPKEINTLIKINMEKLKD